jgi:hypothetical protein
VGLNYASTEVKDVGVKNVVVQVSVNMVVEGIGARNVMGLKYVNMDVTEDHARSVLTQQSLG